jgi:hypothetical protein
VVGQRGLARWGDIDGMDSFEDKVLVIGGVEALDEDGVGFQHEDQLEVGLNPKDQLLEGDDVERTTFYA